MKKYLFPVLMMAAVAFAACCGKNAQPTDTVDSSAIQPEQVVEEVPTTYDINTMKVDSLSNFKGGEGVVLMKMAKAGDNKIMLATLPKGASVGFHAHENDMEVIYVQQGTATILYDSTELTYTPGMVHYCAKGHSHSISNHADEDLVIYNIVAVQP